MSVIVKPVTVPARCLPRDGTPASALRVFQHTVAG